MTKLNIRTDELSAEFGTVSIYFSDIIFTPNKITFKLHSKRALCDLLLKISMNPIFQEIKNIEAFSYNKNYHELVILTTKSFIVINDFLDVK